MHVDCVNTTSNDNYKKLINNINRQYNDDDDKDKVKNYILDYVDESKNNYTRNCPHSS